MQIRLIKNSEKLFEIFEKSWKNVLEFYNIFATFYPIFLKLLFKFMQINLLKKFKIIILKIGKILLSLCYIPQSCKEFLRIFPEFFQNFSRIFLIFIQIYAN